ncbi:MAG TPA: DUF4232 domain-containing protein [Trebonia sp.]|jgi:hypothetical protein
MGSSGVGWRVAALVAFAVTATLVVTLSGGTARETALDVNGTAPTSAPSSQSSHESAAGIGADEKNANDVPRCAASRLRVSLRSGGGASRYEIEFTNVSGRTCFLRGYPRVSAVDGSGRLIGAAARHDNPAAGPVVLPHGASAHADLTALARTLPVSACRPVPAAGLSVVPPGADTGNYVRGQLAACSASWSGAPVFLAVRPVAAGMFK